jgi:hypothetical protein
MAKETNNYCEEYSSMNDEIKMLLIGYFITIKLQKYYEVHDDHDDYKAGSKFCDDYIGYKYYGGYLKNEKERPFYLQNYGNPKREESDKEKYIEFMSNPIIDKYGYIPKRDNMNNKLRGNINKYLKCDNFKIDIIKKIWTLQEAWTEITKQFLIDNLRLLEDKNASSVFPENIEHASFLKFIFESDKAELDGYSKRKTKKSKRRSVKSKRKSKRRSGKSKRKLN